MTRETPRLILVPLSPAHLLTLIEEPERFEERFGTPAALELRSFLVSGEVSPAWLELLRRSSTADPWVHGFAVLHRADRLVIGMASFKGPPDEHGSVEIAYGVVPAYESQGYATEAAAELLAFALEDDRVSTVCAHTIERANASTRVLEKCGFTYSGEVEDPEDGLVSRWECPRKEL